MTFLLKLIVLSTRTARCIRWRWQFIGGMKESERKAFLFTNIHDGKGRKYKMLVLLEAWPPTGRYSVGMGCSIDEMQDKWDEAIKNPITPKFVDAALCHEMIEKGVTLSQEGNGLDALPIPVSTPGFDSAPTCWKRYHKRSRNRGAKHMVYHVVH